VSLRVASRIEGWERVTKSKWPIPLRPHPAEKSAPTLTDISIHRLCSAIVYVRWWGSGVVVGDFRRCISSETGMI
jgi:hypothetical protein